VTLWAAGALIQRLLASYVFDAWPFAILHCIVLLFLARSVLSVIRHTAELREWSPSVATEDGAAAVLSSFIRDSESLGQRGLVVPITDYSDRLDAEVENLVDEVSERSNLLLLVGIAGTLFGVFELAWRASVVNRDRLSEIGLLLSESMAKAFPVGFVGLMLMLVFQFSLALPLARLHRTASDAMRRALEHRGTVSRTLAESISDSIAESMKPVSTLGNTVSEHLQPAVTSLGQHLEQWLSLVKLQFGDIDQSTQRFLEATANLQQSSSALTDSSSRLEDLFRAVPKVLARTEKIQNLHDSAMEELTTSMRRDLALVDAAAESLKRLQDGLSELPNTFAERAAVAIAPVFERVAIESSKTWRDLVQVVAVDIQRDYAEFIASSREELKSTNSEMRALSESMRQLAETALASMTEPLQTALDTARREATATLAEVGEFVRERYPALRDDMSSFRRAMSDIVKTLTMLNGRLSKKGPRAASIDKERDELSKALHSIASELQTRNKPATVEDRSWSARILQLLGLR